MAARDPFEPHRAASPLELFTDLCFVVAVAQAASELHHSVSSGHLAAGIQSFAMVFFAIWLAWINFTWFASAYDNDDVPYRLLTILQIVGVLVLAAGIHRMFAGDFVLGVAGYVIMRVALVGQWLRAAAHDPPHRKTCLRFAVSIVLVQLLWVCFLFVPPHMASWVFLVFALAELAIPVYAEKAGRTTWHPHHVAERYGLFFIIVLGETILSATLAIQGMLNENRTSDKVMCVVVGGILIVFSVWWIYFSRNAGDALAKVKRDTDPFVWGFGHFFIFASGAALGAGLASRVDFWTKHTEVSATTSAAMVTVPVALLLATLWIVHIRPHDSSIRTLGPFACATLLALAATLGPVPEVTAGIICALLLLVELKIESHTDAG